MIVHGRLLLWTGKLLGGSARPHEIHAAFAWSQAPFVAVGWPLLVELPLRAAAADLDPVPSWLARSIEISARLSEPVAWISSVAAVVGAFLWVKYIAEAQRFSSWRAIANQLMAGALLLALIGGAIALGAAFARRFVYGAIGIAAMAVLGGTAVFIERARSRRTVAE